MTPRKIGVAIFILLLAMTAGFRAYTPAVFLPPYTMYPLDTVNVFTIPFTTQLRPGIVKVDTSPYYGMYIDRVDPFEGRTPFRIWIHTNYQYAYSDSARVDGAVVMSPMSCPLKTGWDAPMWTLRWAPPDTNRDPNVVAPRRLAMAAAAQLPLSALRDMAKVSMERYLKRDSTWLVGKAVYQECFGPLPK